jgi:hypothetical protein
MSKPLMHEEIMETEQCYGCGNDLTDGYIEKTMYGEIEYFCSEACFDVDREEE